jgi:hypothetical protein
MKLEKSVVKQGLFVKNEFKESLEKLSIEKGKRALEVDGITVELDGKVLQGDENSQTRMARAIIALSVAPEGATVAWKALDNSYIELTKEDLSIALLEAGIKQTEIWSKYK